MTRDEAAAIVRAARQLPGGERFPPPDLLTDPADVVPLADAMIEWAFWTGQKIRLPEGGSADPASPAGVGSRPTRYSRRGALPA